MSYLKESEKTRNAIRQYVELFKKGKIDKSDIPNELKPKIVKYYLGE